MRFQLLFEKEIADLTQVRQISQLELLARLLQEQAGQLTSYANLSNKLQVSAPTTKEWCTLLHAVFYAFPLRPWSRNLSKALIKEPKWFLYDWSTLKEDGSRLENLVATHLLKNVETWNDLGLGQFGLHFVRDQLGREVAFLLVREDEPWMLLEVKKSDLQISSHLKYFAEILKPRYALQLVETLPQTVESFLEWDSSPRLLSLPSFLSQLL